MQILYEDNHLLVISKPAGMLAQADETGDEDVISYTKAFLKEKYAKPGNVFVGLVHRLDRPASGVMILAKTSKAASRLSEQFRSKSLSKKYVAVVEGRASGNGTCVDYLLKEDQKVRIVSKTHPKGQYAELSWHVIASHSKWSVLEIDLLTGRPHQIRVQLSSRNMPLLGDLRYGAKQIFDGKNLALHCREMTISHPTTKETMTFTAPFPETWNGFV